MNENEEDLLTLWIVGFDWSWTDDVDDERRAPRLVKRGVALSREEAIAFADAFVKSAPTGLEATVYPLVFPESREPFSAAEAAALFAAFMAGDGILEPRGVALDQGIAQKDADGAFRWRAGPGVYTVANFRQQPILRVDELVRSTDDDRAAATVEDAAAPVERAA